jgi:hypothetical protein
METNGNDTKNQELEKKIVKVEHDLKEMEKIVSFQGKQLELNSLVNDLILIVKKWIWPLFITFAFISIWPLVFIIWFLINGKDGVFEVIIAIVKGNISIIVACIIGVVIIICFYLFAKIPRKLKKDKTLFPDL